MKRFCFALIAIFLSPWLVTSLHAAPLPVELGADVPSLTVSNISANMGTVTVSVYYETAPNTLQLIGLGEVPPGEPDFTLGRWIPNIGRIDPTRILLKLELTRLSLAKWLRETAESEQYWEERFYSGAMLRCRLYQQRLEVKFEDQPLDPLFGRFGPLIMEMEAR